ncbi:hypothetical protein VF05_16160 [Nostoc linckia z3]|nr:hypothetical protein VF05_16160 [Nostoc linckia z3]
MDWGVGDWGKTLRVGERVERGKGGKGKGERGKGKGERGKGKGERRKVGAEETSDPNFVKEDKDGSFLSPLPLTLFPVAL